MQSLPRPSWKQCALLVILLSHTIFGSPVVAPPLSDQPSVSFNPKSYEIAENNLHTSLDEEDVFGPTLQQRSDRKKRLFLDVGKKAKQAKFLTIGAASSKVAKSAGKSILKAVANFGIKALIFNFLFSKINQVLDFKNRLVKNFENKNREQNTQILGNKDTDLTTATSSNDNTTTENPTDQIPELNPEKVSLQVPNSVIGPGFDIANGISQVFGTIVQNTALRIARLFEALKPILSSSSSFKSKKRDTDFDFNNLHESETTSAADEENNSAIKTPVKNSFAALTH